ncbi:MAG: polyphenol oxidase family protein [Patescibacteria group bacterium]
MSSPLIFPCKEPIIAMASTIYNGDMKLTSNGGADNRNKFMKYLYVAIPGAELFIPTVVHGNNIMILNEKSSVNFREKVDGLITSRKGIFIGITYADCPSVLLAGETSGKNPVIAAIHAGYQGVTKKIILKAVRKMAEEMEVRRKTLRATIGPSICGKCYEFGESALSLFREYPKHYVKEKGDKSGKYLVDLKGIIGDQLRMSGVRHVYTSPECTYETSHLFSQRRDRKDPIEAGITIIGIKKW